MAMAAPPAISVAAGKARDLLIEETRFLLDVRSQVDQLRDNLNRLFNMLSYLEERQESDRFYRSLVSEAWEVLHDGEDIIDAYTIGVPSSKRSRFSGRQILKVGMNIFTSCLFVKVHKVGSLIGGIRPRLCRITNSVENFIAMRRSLGEGSAGFSLRNVRRRYNPSGSHAHFEEACYGRENSVEEIVSELLTSGKQHQMVTIFEMGGLGKTVVAKKVLMHAEVKRKFERFAWVSLSQGCSSRQLVEKILCDLLPEWKEEISKMEDWEMFRTLYEIQQRRRCLVVLDDFCDIKDWDNIRAGFPLENSISKLLISTRNMEISYHVNPRAYVHKLQLLSQEESFLLLKRKLCAVDGLRMDIEMEKSARKMLQRCGGLPMAISILSSVLLTRRTLSEWQTIKGNISSYLRSQLFKVFSRSYNDLPGRLRRFLLYLGKFPEEAEVPTRKLVQMWAVEGFLLHSSMRTDSMEAEAQDILTQLVERDMIQIVQVDKLTRHIKTCRLHSLVREFCITVAEDVNFYRVLNLRNKDELGSCSSMPTRNIRRLSILFGEGIEGEGSLGEVFVDEMTLHLRSLLLFPEKKARKRNWEQLKHIFRYHKFLRILELEGFEAMEGIVPRSIKSLAHLRYLSFKNSKFEKLPRGIWNLKWIETLDLRGRSSPTSPLVVPNPRRKMSRLRHLYLPHHFSTDNLGKLRLDLLKNLQTLKNFSPTVCEVRDLQKLTHLQKLTAVCSPQDAKQLWMFARDAGIKFKHILCM